MAVGRSSSILAVVIATLYTSTLTSAAPILPSHPESPKAVNGCQGSLHFTVADLNATQCDVITGSIWLATAGIDTIVRLDNDSYNISNAERSVLLHGSVFVHNYTNLNAIPPPGKGPVRVDGLGLSRIPIYGADAPYNYSELEVSSGASTPADSSAALSDGQQSNEDVTADSNVEQATTPNASAALQSAYATIAPDHQSVHDSVSTAGVSNSHDPASRGQASSVSQTEVDSLSAESTTVTKATVTKVALNQHVTTTSRGPTSLGPLSEVQESPEGWLTMDSTPGESVTVAKAPLSHSGSTSAVSDPSHMNNRKYSLIGATITQPFLATGSSQPSPTSLSAIHAHRPNGQPSLSITPASAAVDFGVNRFATAHSSKTRNFLPPSETITVSTSIINSHDPTTTPRPDFESHVTDSPLSSDDGNLKPHRIPSLKTIPATRDSKTTSAVTSRSSQLQIQSSHQTSCRTSSRAPAPSYRPSTTAPSHPHLQSVSGISSFSVAVSEELFFDYGINMGAAPPSSPKTPVPSRASSSTVVSSSSTQRPHSSWSTERSSRIFPTSSYTSVSSLLTQTSHTSWNSEISSTPSSQVTHAPPIPSSSQSDIVEAILSLSTSFRPSSGSTNTTEAVSLPSTASQTSLSTEVPEPEFYAASLPPPALGRAPISGWKPVPGGRPQPERRPPPVAKSPTKPLEDPAQPVEVEAVSNCPKNNKDTNYDILTPKNPAQNRQNDLSISFAKTLPSLPPPKLLPGFLGFSRTVPREYEFLTLDGKITYARANGEHVFDSVLHYADGRSAAVGPGNVVLEEGFVVDKSGRVVSYRGTTVEEVREMRRVEGEKDVRGKRKRRFDEMRRKFEGMERRVGVVVGEEKRLAGEGRKGKKRVGRVGK